MNIREFTQKFDEHTNLKEMLEFRTYIPIAEKKVILETVIDKCFAVEGGVLTCDYILKKISFELAMIKYHTDLEIDITSEDDYDELYKSINMFHDVYLEDYAECLSLFEGMERELRAQYSIESSVASLTDELLNNIEGLVTTIKEKVDDLDMSKFGFESSTIDKFKNLLNKYGK